MIEEVIRSFITNPTKYFVIFWNIDKRIIPYIIELNHCYPDRKIERSVISSIPEHLEWTHRSSKTLPVTLVACDRFYREIVQIDDKIPYNNYPFGQIFYFSDKILIRVGENLNNTDKEIISELFRWFPISKSYNNQEIIVRRETKLNITGDIKVIAS